jgi:hypothetical protein
MSPKKPDESHLVLAFNKPEVWCLHCHQHYAYAAPIPLGLLSALMKAWAKEHRGCKLGPKGKLDLRGPTAPGSVTLEAWWNGYDAGVSSKTIVYALTGRTTSPTNVPLDPDDFGRCYRLLQRFPEFRPRLGEVARKFPEWKGLVAHWDELSALYEEESPSGTCPKLYARMNAL